MRQSLRRPRTVQCLLATTIALALVVLVAPAQAAPARSQHLSANDSSPVLLRDGVIVDLARDVAYVMNREGHIDALRTSDGAVLWSSTEGAKPLAVVDDMLIAQAEPSASGELAFVILDRGAGRTVSKGRVELPEGVWGTVTDRPRATFRAAARPGTDGVVVTWRSSRLSGEDFQGYVPSPNEGRAPGAQLATRSETPRGPEVRQGSATVDPRSGTVPATAAKAGAVASAEVATLRAFDGLAEIEGRKFLSADGRHVLVSRSLGSREVFDRYHWSLYTRGGALVGEVKSHRSAAPFLVAGSLLMFEGSPYVVKRGEELVDQPLRVVAVDLATGVEAWAQPVLQVDFAGPFPP